MDKIVHTTKPRPDTLPGFWEPASIPALDFGVTKKQVTGFAESDAVILENALSPETCKSLVDFMGASPNFEDVGVQGMMDKKDVNIGSRRTSVWSPEIAASIWSKIAFHLTDVVPDKTTATDWWQKLSVNDRAAIDKGLKRYKPVAVSPLLRFMKYGQNGQHYAHYDAGFIYPNDNSYRTLKSMVIYLTTNQGAATRFIKDAQDDVPVWERSHTDWSRPVRSEEVIGKSECVQGNMLLFNHRICHDVQQYLGAETRIIIRGDVVYKLT